MDEELRSRCQKCLQGDILDEALLGRLSAEHNFDTIFHLAALLSTKGERQPTLAHRVNVEGTLNLLEMAVSQSRLQGREIKVLFPSSIAVYGLPDIHVKMSRMKVKESEWLTPRTMYGVNKLYCEHLGRYYSAYYRQLDADSVRGHVDFRTIRFPGIISSETVPTGGTSDYGPEMLHSAAQGKSYKCFAREDTQIPFIVMPDAVEALLQLEEAPRDALTRSEYNVTAFNPTASEFSRIIGQAFTGCVVTFEPDAKRQAILDSWPADLDDSAARADWGWNPKYDLQRAFADYLVPAVARRYTS